MILVDITVLGMKLKVVQFNAQSCGLECFDHRGQFCLIRQIEAEIREHHLPIKRNVHCIKKTRSFVNKKLMRKCLVSIIFRSQIPTGIKSIKIVQNCPCITLIGRSHMELMMEY